MPKLKLTIEDLQVESFAANDGEALRGTVQGHNSFQPASCATLYCGTCNHETCQWTESPCPTYDVTLCVGGECTSGSDLPTDRTCQVKTCIPPE